MTTHHIGEGWSERNKIPTVQEFIEKERLRNSEYFDTPEASEKSSSAANADTGESLNPPVSDVRPSTDLSYLKSTSSKKINSNESSPMIQRPTEANPSLGASGSGNSQGQMHESGRQNPYRQEESSYEDCSSVSNAHVQDEQESIKSESKDKRRFHRCLLYTSPSPRD